MDINQIVPNPLVISPAHIVINRDNIIRRPETHLSDISINISNNVNVYFPSQISNNNHIHHPTMENENHENDEEEEDADNNDDNETISEDESDCSSNYCTPLTISDADEEDKKLNVS